MEYNNMRVVELKSLAIERGLRGYSRLRKSRLIDLIRNNSPPQVPQPTSSKYTKFKPYQLRSKRGKRLEIFLEPSIVEPPIEQPPDPKKLKRMKKKLDELNRKIRHSRKKHDEMIRERNSLRKAMEILKRGVKPEPEFIFKELEQAFGRAYRSYRVKGEPKMDYDAFFIRVREGLIELISRELNNRNSAKIQTSVWIRFTKLTMQSILLSIV